MFDGRRQRDVGVDAVRSTEGSAMTDTTAEQRATVISTLGLLLGGPEERYDRITRMAREVFGVPVTFINLVDNERVRARSVQGFVGDGQGLPLEEAFCSATVQQAEPTIVPDTALDSRFRDLAVVRNGPSIRFYAGAPLTMPDGTRVGTICLMDQKPRAFTEDEIDRLRDFARWAERELSQSMDDRRLQKVLDGLIPDAIDLPGYRLDAVTARGATPSGALADWRVTENGEIALAIGDVVGGGAAAGLLAAGVRGALVARSDDDLDASMQALERQIGPELSKASAVASVFQARCRPSSGRLDFVDAGHGLALHVRGDGSVNDLRSLDLPIGVHPTAVLRASGSVLLHPGDRLVLFTSGVLDVPDLGDTAHVARAAMAGVDGGSLVDRIRETAGIDAAAIVLTRLAEGTAD
jgi:hypothetical protein